MSRSKVRSASSRSAWPMVPGLDELAPLLAQCQADALAEGRVVLHDEDLMHEISPLIC